DISSGRNADHRRCSLFRRHLSSGALDRRAGKPIQGGASLGLVTAESLIVVERLVKRFGPATVLNDVNLKLGAGQVLVVIGPSGSGKSTLLRCLAALETIQRGTIRIDGTLAT